MTAGLKYLDGCVSVTFGHWLLRLDSLSQTDERPKHACCDEQRSVYTHQPQKGLPVRDCLARQVAHVLNSSQLCRSIL